MRTVWLTVLPRLSVELLKSLSRGVRDNQSLAVDFSSGKFFQHQATTVVGADDHGRKAF